MGRRLISCDFFNASSFKVKLTNKAKLMYLYLITNADDKGFVANALETARMLQDLENETENNSLVMFTYENALDELVENGLCYRFTDNYDNDTYLIRHWFYHNKLVKGLDTNFQTLLKKVELIDNKWQMRKKPLKENKESKENNVNNTNNENNQINKETEKSAEEMSFEEIIEDMEKQ